MANTTTLANAAMRIYDKTVHDQVFTENVLWNNILRNGMSTTVMGTTKYMKVHYGRNIGYIAGSETVTLPTAGYQAYKESTISMKYHFHQGSLTDVALQASNRAKEYLVNALESEYNGMKNDMQRQLSRAGYGFGTGAICRVNDASPDTNLTLDTPFAGKYPTDYLEADDSYGSPLMFSSAVDAATSAAYTTIAANGVTGNYTITVTSDSGIADNDYVFLAHFNGTTTPTVSNVNSETMGLAGLIDDTSNLTTLQNLSRSTYPWWKSYVNSDSTQRSLTEALLHSTHLEATKYGKPKYILTHHDVKSAYGQLLSPDRRYTDKMTLNGGFTGLSFNEIPMVADRDCPYDEAYFIDPSTISVEDLAKMSFLNEDGSILDRSSTTPAWNFTLRYYVNLATNNCRKNAVLRDIIK